MITIEKILELDNKISMQKLIYSKYEKKWIFVIVIIIIFICFLLFVRFKIRKSVIDVLIFFLILFCGIFMVYYINNKNSIIARKYYEFSLSKNKNWNYKPLQKIRQRIIKKELEGKIELNKENLIFLIESLKKDKERKEYKYSFMINALIIMISVYLGGFLGSLGNYTNNLSANLNSYRYIGVAFVLIFAIIYYFDIIVIKGFILELKRKKYRLIRVFENIYLEKINKN